MKKIIFFLFLLIVLSGCQVINQPVDNQNNSQDNNLAVDDSVKACQTDSGASLTLEEALAIANDSTCVQEGAVKEDCNCNATTGTCWLDMDVEGHEGCNPACVVNIETGEAEVNWRCTGLIVE
ncbi:MAG TPA: membrane lipoprotein lipid attachment site-containing protein [Patescibacteria group bacterium]|nr:membrane lipoprotein lipid attachment site-containing protein [Patescibacteria group bacterium]